MHRRHGKRNIPIELLRALVTVVDKGSFTKAAEALNLTQSAISSQVARLGQLLGGSIFAKGPGISPTNRGFLALKYARRILEVNDELLASAGTTTSSHQIVVGLPVWFDYRYLSSFFERCPGSVLGQEIAFRSDHTERLIRDLHSGSLDIAFLCNAEESWRVALTRWSEKTVWVKSPKLILSPGAPIPLIGWPGTYPFQVAVDALRRGRMQFYVSFSAPDFSARLAAAAAGLGVFPIQERILNSDVAVVQEGLLPALPDNKTGLFAREGLNLQRIEPLIRGLKEAFAPPRFRVSTVSRPVKFRPRPSEPRPASVRAAR